MDKLHILCIDDQREVLTSVSLDIACFSDHVVIEECESAEEAWELLGELSAKNANIALFICDYLMPGVNGVDLLAQVAKDPRFPHARKILLTGQAGHKDTINAINHAHIDYYLEKPWNADVLRARCRQFLTEYLFDAGLYDKQWASFADPEVLRVRLAGGE